MELNIGDGQFQLICLLHKSRNRGALVRQASESGQLTEARLFTHFSIIVIL